MLPNLRHSRRRTAPRRTPTRVDPRAPMPRMRWYRD